MKKIIAVILVVVLIVSSIIIFPLNREDVSLIDLLPGTYEVLAAERNFDGGSSEGIAPVITPLSINQILTDQTPRDGYILAPSIFGLSGVDPLASFVLRTPTNYSASMPAISIDGNPEPTISREDNNTFVITPTVPLTYNSVYVFRLTREDQDITWAFQTTVRFEIASTLPRNQSTNVPVRTGIEIDFSFGAAPDISNHFSIYPTVEGTFSRRGTTAIFMPTEPLAYGQVYTVTISEGIALPGTSEVINTAHTFAFETASAADQTTNNNWDTRVHFSNRHITFPTFAPPTVHFWFNYDRNNPRPVIDMQLYRMNDRASAISAVGQISGAHHWARHLADERIISTSGLTRISSTRVNAPQDANRWSESFTLPDILEPGFYLLNAVAGDSVNQMIIQITDLTAQVIADEDKALLWVHDMSTGRPVAASVRTGGRTYNASSYGIAVVDRRIADGENLIISAEGKDLVVFVNSSDFDSFHSHFTHWDDWHMPMPRSSWDWAPRFSWHTANSYYWTALQLDRTLFQRDDTINLWGFVQNRRRSENITHVTAVLTEHAWWHLPERDTLHRQNISVVDGAYSGEIRLPNVDPGFYELAIFHGDIMLSSIFFSVMDYVKPPYQLTVSASHAAVFAGEEVRFTAHTAFFEGTPVPDLEISHEAWGWELRAPGRARGQTNRDGILEIIARPTAETAAVQGERQLTFSAEATLPEIGWTHQSAGVRVFVNDIDVRPRATREGRDASLTVNVNNITLDRINDGTAEHWRDFLCSPVSGQRLSVNVVQIYWERVRDGQRYCHVIRQVVPRYRYERRENSVTRFDMTTNASGEASRDFQVTDRQNATYLARITTTDGNGRSITETAFIGRDWTTFHRHANEDFPFLYGVNPEGYDVGDPVELTIMRGTEAVTQGNFLFVVVQNGILSYHVGTNPLSFAFDERHVPNAQVFAFHFNGHTYHTSGHMSQRLNFNTADRVLNITVAPCQTAYRPGESATITVTVTDQSGRPKAANVNISIVDEALFALMDYDVDTVAMLYGQVNDRLRFAQSSHRTFISDGIETEDEQMYGWSGDMAMRNVAQAMPAAAEAADAGGGGGDTRIRERFEDTAIFRSVRTNSQGTASFSFELPDNITSWRMTASAISTDLYAGNSVQQIRVTQPMFAHYTLASTFLVGDTPYIGVNAFGTSLTGGEQVNFEVWRESAPTDIRSATGVSFARINIPLWEKTAEGMDAIVIRATVAGYSDAIRHEYQVINSHRQVDVARFYEVTPSTMFEINPGGLTNITFTDHGRGQFLWDLFSLRSATWRSGARIEGHIARREATRMIETHFPDVTLFRGSESFDVSDYQQPNGGIAILPYSEAELLTTVLLLPFIQDEVNLPALRGYLRSIADSSPTDNKMLALYGLAMLGEPVLLELRRYAALDNLSVRNAAYVGLALAVIGEEQAARDLYAARIAPHLRQIAPYYRVDIGANRREILDVTSVAALLAARLGMPEAIALHNYATRNRQASLTIDIERLKFISYEINNHTRTAASITYTLFGERVTRELGHGGSFTLRIPAQNMNQFNLVSVTGEVGAVSIIRVPLEDVNIVETDLSVTRQFFRAGSNTATTTFDQDELIRVQITINYSQRNMEGSYMITDFLPAGLALVENSARFGNRGSNTGWWAHATTEGQRVTFFDFNRRFYRVNTYYYYARVVNPGTFRAEGTLVQSVGAREYMVVGADTTITVR